MVTTRSQARQVQREPLATDRKIDLDIDVGGGIALVVTVPSATGKGTHTQWISLKVPQRELHELLPRLELKEPGNSQCSSPIKSQIPDDESPRITTGWFRTEEYEYSTPKSSPPVTPSAPKRPTRRPPTPVTPVRAALMPKGENEKYDECLEEAARKLLEARLKKEEKRTRRQQNMKRVRKFAKESRPDLLREVEEETVQVDLREEYDPFL